MKKFILVLTLLFTLVLLVACDPVATDETPGVTDTEILIGNTAASSGAFAGVGVPFNQGLEAYLKMINDAGGVNGRTIKFMTKDDGFDATIGLNLTKELVEEEKIFALVGHFGTPTVGATLEYIQDVRVPMVYAATGINDLYFERSPLNPVFAVQPIYLTDGRLMTARLLNEELFDGAKLGANAKIGVLHTTSDDGTSIKAGIEAEALFSNRKDDFIYVPFDASNTAELAAAILDLKQANVEAVIVASNQAPFKAAVGAMQTGALHVPVFTSYVNADATSIDAAVDYTFDIYANAWVDMLKVSDEAANTLDGFTAAINAFDPELGGVMMPGVAFAIAGYIAAKVFVDGLKAVGTEELTRESYIQALENAGTLDIPMGGTITFGNGQRWGIDSMSLLKLTTIENEAVQNQFIHAWVANKPIETLAQIQAK